MDSGDLRKEDQKGTLTRAALAPDPFEQFSIWWEAALASDLREPNAMSMATVDLEGRPRIRTVLLKNFDKRGFIFYTNYESLKAQHIEHQPWTALLFVWAPLERQIMILGEAAKIERTESQAYFDTRPLLSRIGTWASPQSQVIASREELERRFQQRRDQFTDGQVPLPPFWGGYRVVPASFEFWQGRPNRLHDRFQYQREPNGLWTIQRLAP